MANRNINGDVNVEFNEASSRQGLDSGESVKTLFGKIRKWLSDLKAVAFSGSYNDLTNKPTIPPAVAVKGNAETAYRTGNVNLTAANLGLGNVDNTSDANKPISTATQAALDSQQGQVNYNTNNGVKNQLITDNKSGTVTSYGVTVTSNNDGTFTINGTNSNSGYTLIAMNLSDLSMRGGTGGINQITPKTIKSNKVKFYAIGLPSNLNFQLAKSTTVSADGVSVNTVSGSAVSNVIDITNYDYVWFRLVAHANASYNNVVIKPMVVDASVEDTGDFVPYAEPNYQLTQKVDKALEQTGYNMLEITANTQTINGVTFTVDKVAGTITANGTATEYTAFFINMLDMQAGNYLSGCPNGGSRNTYWIDAYDGKESGYKQYVDVGNGVAIPISDNYQVRIVVRYGQTLSNLIFKPMIVPAELAGVPFQPYAKSNAELTQDLDDISGELDCLLIQAALVNDDVIIQNMSDFTSELYSKYFSYTKPKFAILKLQITSNTHYYKALINSLSVSQGNLMEASFMTMATGEYIYNFTWLRTVTVGTPTVIRKALNLGG